MCNYRRGYDNIDKMPVIEVQNVQTHTSHQPWEEDTYSAEV